MLLLDNDLLAIYLNDHLAAATAAGRLARRALGANRDNEFGRALEPLAREIEEDQETLREVMRRLDVGVDRLKSAAATGGELAGRLKLNGRLLSYSPLSRLVEFEALALGVEGKRGLWKALGVIGEPRLDGVDFGELEERALRHRRVIERQRLNAARIALSERGEG
jgi:hypothetical protein